MKQNQKKLLISNKWELGSDSKWNIHGKVSSVFGFKFVDMFEIKDKISYWLLLAECLDNKIEANPINGRLLFKTTRRELTRVFGCRTNSVRVRLDSLIKAGLIEVKYKSTRKGVPSEYYLMCPATILIKKLKISDKPEQKNRINEKESEIDENDNPWL